MTTERQKFYIETLEKFYELSGSFGTDEAVLRLCDYVLDDKTNEGELREVLDGGVV